MRKPGKPVRTPDFATCSRKPALAPPPCSTWSSSSAPDGREYLAVHAERVGRRWLVLWRDLAGLDVKAEREFLEPRIAGFDEVRINGDSAVPGIRAIDLDLARAMGAA